jgi:hypothetical protein
MPRPDQGALDLVSAVLNAIGFQVEEIRESDEATPDLLASAGNEKHLVEVKQKLSVREASNVSFDPDTGLPYFYFERSTGYSNRLAGILHKAARQLKVEPTAADQPFRLAWVVATGPDANLFCTQMLASLYGIRQVSFRQRTGALSFLPCFYARNSVFFKYRESIDGVVVGGDRSGKLCLNDQSRRYDQLRCSLLAARFADGVIDPGMEEARGHAFQVTDDVAREREAALLEYLNSKYGDLQADRLFDLEHHRAEVWVPDLAKGCDEHPPSTNDGSG